MSSEEATRPSARPTIRHRLSYSHLDALAHGGGDEHTISELLAAERSWRMIQLRAVLDAVRSQPGATDPLPSIDDAWNLLVRAERRAPSDVNRLLLHPQAGTWAGYVLRRLRNSTPASAPLWVDIGYLHAIAAAAAIRAGLDFAIRVPAREGYVAIPTLGAAQLPVRMPWDFAEVRGSARQTTVTGGGDTVRVPQPDATAEGWIGLPTISVEVAGSRLSVNLDGLDPYRNLRQPAAPQPPSSAQVERWRSSLAEAWRLLVDTCPDLAAPLGRGLFSVVPLPAVERFRTMSASAGDAFGSMVISEPETATALAVTLVHEFQHVKLGGVLHLAALHEGEPPQRLYAPWRDDPRPLAGLLQGVYAFAGITEFWRAFRKVVTEDSHLAQYEFALWRQQVIVALQQLQGLPQLTDIGRQLVVGLTEKAASWRNEEVPAAPRAIAGAVAADHRARWRIHHLKPDQRTVEELAAAWSAREDKPALGYPAPVVEPDGSARWLDTINILTLWRLTDPVGFMRLRRAATRVGEYVSGATVADVAYVAGDHDGARELLLAEIADGPRRPGAWVSLGLTLASDGPSPAADALLDHPELVSAVYGRLRASADPLVDPVELAAWIGGAATLADGLAES